MGSGGRGWQDGGVIVGVGVDVCDVGRWQAAVARHPGIATRVLTPAEAARRPESQAARFAAKEALVKALGGSEGLRWHDAEVVSDESGAPSFLLRGTAAEAARNRGIDRIHLSISHDGGMAVAFVVAEGS